MTLPEDKNSYSNDEQPYEGQPDSFSQNEPYDQQASFATRQLPPLPISGEETGDFEFPSLEDDVAAFRRQLEERQFVTPHRVIEDNPVTTAQAEQPPLRRRRRSQRLVERLDGRELDERFASIIQRASPSFDFFVFSILCGCILAIGYILDAPAILLIGILVAPLLATWVGVTLSAATGEVRFFGQTLGGLLTALGLVFAIGLLAGFASRIFQPLTTSQAFYHARLWWPDLLMLVIGTIVLVLAFIQSNEKPVLASLMVAYQFYLPISAAGFGLGSGSAVKGLWPEAGLVFIIHLALSLIVGLVVFYYMGFRPQSPIGYLLTASIILASLVIIAGFAGIGSLINVRGDQVTAAAATLISTATETPLPVASSTQSPPTSTLIPSVLLAPSPSITLPPPTASEVAIPKPSATLVITAGPSLTLLPTPVYGRIFSPSGGVMVRVKPAGGSITTVQNGYLVEFLSDKPVIIDGFTWVHVLIKTPIRDIDGWVLLSLIITATPSGSP